LAEDSSRLEQLKVTGEVDVTSVKDYMLVGRSDVQLFKVFNLGLEQNYPHCVHLPAFAKQS